MARALHQGAIMAKLVLNLLLHGFQLRLLNYLIRTGAADGSDGERHWLLPMNTTTSEELILSDGRILGLAFFGAKNGPAIFDMHGYPGCRLSAGVFLDRAGKKFGTRVITIDRPGIGNSSPQPGRKLVDLASDIREVAEHLDLQSYGIIGASGGGPYALACAHELSPKNLKGVSIIGGMGPVDCGFEGMNWSNWLTFFGLMYCPFIVRWLQKRFVQLLRRMPNEKIIQEVQEKVKKKPTRFIGRDMIRLLEPEPLATILDLYREHYKQGVDGYMGDGRVLTTDWGFQLADIPAEIPIQMWYSKKDTNVPIRMGEAIASRIKPRRLEFHVAENETHLELMLNYSERALKDLLDRL